MKDMTKWYNSVAKKRTVKKYIKKRSKLQYVKEPWKDDWKAIEQLVIDFGIAFPETMTFVG